MKRLLLLSLFLSFIISGYAQVSKTVNVTTPGTLSTVLTSTGLATITNLTITGTIDARDFVTMRDSMSVLAVVDLSAVTIAAYTGTGGTDGNASITYPDNELPQYAFFNPFNSLLNHSFTTIVIPSSIISIGDDAFAYCKDLTSIAIPSSVTSIGVNAFLSCSGLITVDANNLNYSSKDGVLFNKNQTTLIQCPVSKTGSYAIPSSVASIEDFAFIYCNGLTSVAIPTSVTSIGKHVFESCNGLTSVIIPSSVTSIGDYAFASCSGLITVDANNPNYSSKDGVLFDKNQTTLIQCPVSKTGSYTIPSSVTSIGVYAFVSCKDLTSIAIPSSVISFRMGAFGDCSGLTSLIIPSSVTSIGDFAFWNCTGLTSLYASATSPVNLSSLYFVFLGVNTNGCTLYVPKGSLSLYKAAYLWNGFVNIAEFTPTPTSVTSITTSALKGYTQNGQLIVTGMNQGETLTVYTIHGTTIYSHTTDGNQVVVNLPARGIYIVKAGAQSVRVVD